MTHYEELRTYFAERWPLPDDVFARGFALSGQIAAAAQLRSELVTAQERCIAEILEEGLTSESYQLMETFRCSSVVDAARVRAELPEVFAELVHIPASAAQKILSRRRLYELCCEAVGADALRGEEIIVKEELRRRVLASDFASYLYERQTPTGHIFVRREEK